MRGKIIIPDEVVQQKKDRKISRELNATMAHGNALDAREKRIGELKWLFEFKYTFNIFSNRFNPLTPQTLLEFRSVFHRTL